MTAHSKTEVEMCYWGLLQHLIDRNVALYQKKHRSVQIIANAGGGTNYVDYLASKFSQNDPPDFFQAFNDVNAFYAQKGWSGVLEDRLPEAAEYGRTISNEQYRKSILTPDGRVHSMIYYGAHAAFMYNRKHLSDAGFADPPRDWDEVIVQATKVKSKGQSPYPLVLGLSGPGYIEAFYSLMLGMNTPQSCYLFDEDFRPLFADPKSTLFTTLRWMIDAIHKHKILTADCVKLGAFDATYSMGQQKHTFSWLPRYVLPIICYMSMSRNVTQTLNPGYGYTSCYSRIYAPSKKVLEGDESRLEEVWKVMQYFGGKTNESLEPDIKRGRFRVLKSMAIDSGIPSPVDELWKDKEYRTALDEWSPIKITEEQDRKVYNALCDPWPAPWFHEWANEWGDSPFKVALHRLLRNGADNAELEVALLKLARDWNRLRSEGSRHPGPGSRAR